jgi:hypothetical protein
MTLDLDALKRLEREATSAPWVWSEHGACWLESGSGATIIHADPFYGTFPDKNDPDGKLIAAARTALPKLIERVEELETVLKMAHDTFKSWTGPLRESAEYMQSQGVFPGTVQELSMAADFQRKAIAAIDAALSPKAVQKEKEG